MIVDSVYKNQASETPYSNTGSVRQERHDEGVQAHLDYLVVVGNGDISTVENAVWACFGANFDHEGAFPGCRGVRYDCILQNSQGIELAYSLCHGSSKIGNYRLSIPGKPLSHIKADRLHDFGKYLAASGVRCTRWDWAIDDFTKTLDLSVVYQACEAGSYARCREHRYYARRKRGDWEVGRTIYMGSSQSDKQVRIYDKNVESKGEVNSIRFEVQFRDDLAHYSFLMYFSHETCESAVKEASSYALGSVDFIDRVSSVLSRCPRSAFWEDFIALVGEAVRLSVPRLQTMLSDKKRWVENQVAGTIALISRCIGYDDTLHWLQQQIREKLVARNTRADEFVQTWKDRLVVEQGGFADFFAISSW